LVGGEDQTAEDVELLYTKSGLEKEVLSALEGYNLCSMFLNHSNSLLESSVEELLKMTFETIFAYIYDFVDA